ncbi:competence protein CoiA family protein [Pseudomonas baetica]|uniref:competence protein CoiA family protein n=1 Tax=Pseudomonas baetica TaxID=674054 RepID=UPI002892ABB4|nr:competence protein CoiA family protein [Pseudomonas baetica]
MKLSKGRQVLMPDTKLPAQAKTLRWDGGITRYFSHFPGESPEGYTSTESPEHIAMKVAIYKALVDLGIRAELEDGVDDWRADILVGDSAFAPRLAIEVQISPQSAQRTYERTEQRNHSGVPTLWIFGSIGLTGRLSEDLARRNPIFVAETPQDAADIGEPAEFGKNRTLRFSGHP